MKKTKKTKTFRVALMLLLMVFISCQSDIQKINKNIESKLINECNDYKAQKTEIKDTINISELEKNIDSLRGLIYTKNFMREMYVKAMKENELLYEKNMEDYENCEIYYLRNDFLRIADDHLELVNDYKNQISEIDSLKAIWQGLIKSDSLQFENSKSNKDTIAYYLVNHVYLCDSSRIEKSFRINNELEIIAY